jgi:alpha-tubulin suppressor-like RCC1 family protein
VCWGQNEFGELGNNGTGEALNYTVVQGVSGAVQLALGIQFSCALLATGQVKCWGLDDLGQLGIGTANQNPNASPVTVSGLSDATGIGAGLAHVCVSRKNGNVMCWGQNDQGQLGDGSFDVDASTPNASPVAAASVTTATGIGQIFGVHSCATLSNGGISCWGTNDFDELGLGQDVAAGNVYTPAKVDYP